MWVKFIKQTYSEKIQGHDPFNNQPSTSNFNFNHYYFDVTLVLYYTVYTVSTRNQSYVA